ncbi:Thioredoxin reductase [Nosema bombycis CQ1]|uniref:Thioredoxin reductase n=1 Tax=Nosema bombycis (strain CQ1 / CVCC 102059) TaxID=578461 RepID=R0KXG4_NOSB1|nr:Thioredoxin reductase [Nosema bombycis CQ1]|eukprot:EOB15596.1 Thioredoxin reductase [Nosema bombycis CQ1]
MVENVIIIGSGPAAYSAALYCKSTNPLILRGGYIGANGPGGQLTTTTTVDNYPGFPKGVQGPDLMDMMYKHADNYGIRQTMETVENVKKEGDNFLVHTDEGVYETRAVIVATGACAKRMYVPGTNDGELWQKGISACAVCDGFFFKDKIVCVIGGGDTAMVEAEHLSHIAKKVIVIHRRNEFRARPDNVEKVRKIPNVEYMTPFNLQSAHGEGKLEYIKLKNALNDEFVDLKVDGMFFGIGHLPNTSFLKENMSHIMDDLNYIVADSSMSTKENGLFACGDVIDKVYRQAVTSAGMGCLAGIQATEYIKKL